MIFLTLGTHEPFDRLVRAVDEWCADSGRGDEVFGQITSKADFVPQHFRWVERLDPEEYRETATSADVIVSHAGMGSIITALTFQKPIVVMPRRGHLGETRNDHQFATAERLGQRPGIVVAMDEGELPGQLTRVVEGAHAHTTQKLSPFADPQLVAAIRNYVIGEGT